MAMPTGRVRQWSEAITPPTLTRQYEKLTCTLLALDPQIDAKTGRHHPVLLTFSPAAKAQFVDFVNRHGAEMDAFQSDRLKSAWSKLEGQAARLALLFHCIREIHTPSAVKSANTISANTLDAALAWIEWLNNETRRIYHNLTYKGDADQASKLVAFAGRNGGAITARAAARAGAGGRIAQEVEEIMAGLIAAGLADWHIPAKPRGGRPTRYFRLKSVPLSAKNMPPLSRN